MSITWGELIGLLLFVSVPIFLVPALIQCWFLRRARVPALCIAASMIGSALLALPVTLFAWWASGFLPASWVASLFRGRAPDTISVYFAYIGPPAVIASAIVFSFVSWLALRGKRRAPSKSPAPVGADE